MDKRRGDKPEPQPLKSRLIRERSEADEIVLVAQNDNSPGRQTVILQLREISAATARIEAEIFSQLLVPRMVPANDN